MAQLNVVKLDKKKAEPFELDDLVSEAVFNPFLIKDVVVYQQAKQRLGTHSTKTRSMIIGSRHKLYRQKGTGSARVGDRKSPIRRGGGVAHGPHPRDHSIRLNKKVRKAALRSAIAEKIRQEKLMLVDSFELSSHKTKELQQVLTGLEVGKALIVVEDIGHNLELASRNLPDIEVVHHGQLNVYNLLRYDKTLMTRGAMAAVQERLTR